MVRQALARWWRDRRGAMAVEFVLISPLMLLVTVGIFESIFLISDAQTASEATRRGARIALIEAPIATLTTVSTANSIVCTGQSDNSVTCTGGTVNGAATFTDIVAAMQAVAPWVTAPNVRVTYAASGIDTKTDLLTPLITVELIGATYQPKATSSFDLDFAVPLPSFETSQLGPTIVND